MEPTITLNLLVTTIIHKYFINSRCIFLISDNSISFDYQELVPIVNLKINENIESSLIFRSYGCQTFIINHSNATHVLAQLEREIKLQADRFNFRQYLIVPAQNQTSKDMMEMFNMPELQYIVNLLVIVPQEEYSSKECEDQFGISCSEDTDYELFTHKYVGTTDNNEPQLLDVWLAINQTFENRSHLFPDKIANQFGRALRCATFTYEPYSIVEGVQNMAKGSENTLAHEFANRLNMTLEYVLDDEQWGIIYENGTGNGVLGNLVLDYADLSFAALYTWPHEYGFLDLSKPVVRTGITCLVPAPRLAAGWLLPLFPFSLLMWIGTVISFVVCWIVTAKLTSFDIKGHFTGKTEAPRLENQTYAGTLLKMVRIFLVQSVPSMNKPTDIAFKYLFVVNLFAVLMTCSYSSGLATVMTIPRYQGTINTVSDLADSGYYCGATQDAWIFSIMDDERPQYITLVNRFIAAKAEYLIEYSKGNNFAFSIERLPSGQYAIGSYVTEEVVKNLRLLKEDLYWEYCVFMLRKSSPLLNSLDNLLLILAQSGLILFWEMKAAQTRMDLRVQNIVRYYREISDKQDQGDTVQLKWIHVEGTFAILIGGYVLSVLSFIREVVVHKINKRKKKLSLLPDS